MRVLQLNADYTPNCTISVEKAIKKIIAGKAEAVVESGRVFRSQRSEITVPSVVRLVRQAKTPYINRSIAIYTRTVLARDNGICAYCGGVADTIDHVWPKARGGAHTWENVVAACRRCNFKKGQRTLEQLGWGLLYQPFRPTGIGAWMLKMKHLPDEWRPFLGLPKVGGGVAVAG